MSLQPELMGRAQMTVLPDNGCEGISASCLMCPLPDCTYDVGGGRARWARKQQAKHAPILAYLKEHPEATDAEVAAAKGVWVRTVQRAKEAADD